MIVFDTETTGLLPNNGSPLEAYPYLIEFAGIKLDDTHLSEIDRLEFMVNPGVPIPEIITKITGITEDDVKELDSFANHFADLVDFFQGQYSMCAHNVGYDEIVLESAFKRIGKERCFPWPTQHICTVEATVSMPGVRKGKSGRFNLSELHLELTGEKLVNTHRAMGDVEGLVRCVRILRERGLV
jgi:DNA polymerase III epsilon subunit-like protein